MSAVEQLPDQPLTERQQFAYDLLKDGPLYPEEIGQAWHGRPPASDDAIRHPGEGYCDYCGITGLDVLRELKELGLVEKRRNEHRKREWFRRDLTIA